MAVFVCLGVVGTAVSMRCFSDLGFDTMGAGFYDQTTADRTLENARQWIDAMNATSRCRGLMYTTWAGERGHYELLPLFAEKLGKWGVPK